MKANTDLSLGTKNISYYYMYMATTSVQYYEQTDVDDIIKWLLHVEEPFISHGTSGKML